MIILAFSKKRIKDRGISWKETYKEKSKSLKKHFDKVLPGSYFRWEGMDHTTGHPYYIVVGPSISERYGKSFFAGIKKMPLNQAKSYSPSGKYFSTLSAAFRYASETWGLRLPRNKGNYTKNHLVNIKIPEHVKG